MTNPSASNPRILVLRDARTIQAEMARVGVHPDGIPLMAPKAITLAIKLHQLGSPAAIIVKQEMLALGGDAAVAGGVVDGSEAVSDVVLLGNLKIMSALIPRLKHQPFGLRRVAEEIAEILPTESRRPLLLHCGGKTFDLSSRTHLMGVLNVTPDSFSDGAKYFDPARAAERALELAEEGADFIDIGGESSRPGSSPVIAQQELSRILPVIEHVAKRTEVPISVDTYKADVAESVLDAGAVMINDISALRFDNRMAELVASRHVPVVLMHMKGTPRDMQMDPSYDDVMDEVHQFLSERLRCALAAGIKIEQVVLDPGLGFGKRLEDNLVLLSRLAEITGLGCPILVGPSRKSFIGKTLDLPVDQRLEGTAAAVAVAILNGAHVVRIHNVKEMRRVARMVDAIKGAQ